MREGSRPSEEVFKGCGTVSKIADNELGEGSCAFSPLVSSTLVTAIAILDREKTREATFAGILL